MEIKRYEPRTQGGVFEKNMPVTTFLRDTFFPDFETFATDKVEMDVRKGGQIVAPFVAPYVNGILVTRAGYKTREYEPPTIAPKRALNPELLNKTIPGEHTHTTMSPEERQQYYIERDLRELDDSITRREELMIAQVLTTGKITVRGYHGNDLTKYVDNEIDYGFEQIEVLSGGAKWDQLTSTKYDDLERGIMAVREAGYNPRAIVIGAKAWRLLKSDADFLKKLDITRINLGSIVPDVRTQNGNGNVYLGDLTEFGVELWAYYAWYQDTDGTKNSYIPEDHVLFLPGVIGDIAYGAVTYLEQTSFNDGRYVTYEGTRITRTLINQQSNTKEMLISSKPVPRPFDLESWYVMKVV